ncbi:hypothetical protein WDU94_010389 [Cyamophila willieti]
MGDNMLFRSRRINLSTYKDRHFQLHIHQAAKSDEGCYMCQVNTEVMMKQIGCVDIMTPPDVENESSPSDVVVNEFDNATLKCEAKGHPMPNITWFRDDKKAMTILNPKNGEVMHGK